MRWLVLPLSLVILLIPGCGSSGLSEAEKTRQSILRVLQVDHKLAKEIRERLPANSTPSQISLAYDEYCRELERLDMSDCPADFRVAYRHHMVAWREAIAAIRQQPDNFLQGVLMGAVNFYLRREVDGGANRLEGALKHSMERVRDSWHEVERIGAKYGAAL